MGNLLDISKFTMYRILTDDELLVAVSSEYVQQIDLLLREHKNLENIPSSKTIRGRFIKKSLDGDLKMLTAPEQENDITVNQLRPIN